MRRLATGTALAFWAIGLLGAAANAATIGVTTQADVRTDDGLCSLREAIRSANTDTASGGATGECAAGAGGDVVSVPSGVYTLSLEGGPEDLASSGALDISTEVTITGAGAGGTFIDGGGIDRFLDVPPTGTATIQDVTI